MGLDSKLTQRINQQMRAQQELGNVATSETGYAIAMMSLFLQQLAAHRAMQGPPGTPHQTVAEMSHAVTVRAYADQIITAILQQQPAMAGLVEGVTRSVRERVKVEAKGAPTIVAPGGVR